MKKKNNKKKILTILSATICSIFISYTTAFADMAPPPGSLGDGMRRRIFETKLAIAAIIICCLLCIIIIIISIIKTNKENKKKNPEEK